MVLLMLNHSIKHQLIYVYNTMSKLTIFAEKFRFYLVGGILYYVQRIMIHIILFVKTHNTLHNTKNCV